MRQLNVLFIPHPVQEIMKPWGEDTLEAIDDSHRLRVFDPAQEAAPQFEGVEVVVDLGGNMNADLIQIAAAAGVKFVQAQTNGLDHVEVEKIRDAGMILAHCPGELSSVALAESAMMFILMLANQYGEGLQNFAAGKFFFPTGMELVGRSLGIVGFGHS